MRGGTHPAAQLLKQNQIVREIERATMRWGVLIID